MGRQANRSLRVILDEQKIHSVAWNRLNPELLLSADTLKPMGKSPRFEGFLPDREIIICIGIAEMGAGSRRCG
jgi:hypothetical protein